MYPSVFFSNKYGGENKYLYFLGTYTILDTLLYPVDVLKNLLYAETHGRYRTLIFI